MKFWLQMVWLVTSKESVTKQTLKERLPQSVQLEPSHCDPTRLKRGEHRFLYYLEKGLADNNLRSLSRKIEALISKEEGISVPFGVR